MSNVRTQQQMQQNTFDLARYIFPLFSANLEENSLHIHRFIGMGFWLNEHGFFATCRHVLEMLEKNQLAVVSEPFGNKSDHFFPVHETTLHPTFDIAVGKAPASAVGGVLGTYTGQVSLGLDVQAFGYTDSGKVAGSYEIDPRLLKGHLSRVSAKPHGLPSPSLIEVSFGSPSGFSGTPLLVGTEVVGILYSNLDSRLQAYSIQETIEGQSEYREAAYRIYEYGIAHRFSELLPFFKECGVPPWG